MSIAGRPDEVLRADEGAPQGPTFDVLVPSKSEPGRQYRVARDLAGALWHVPSCTAWRYGNRECAHVRRAIELSEDPAWTFVADVIAAWGEGGWHPDGRAEFAAGVFRGAQEAMRRRAQMEAAAERAGRPPADPAESLAKFAGAW